MEYTILASGESKNGFWIMIAKETVATTEIGNVTRRVVAFLNSEGIVPVGTKVTLDDSFLEGIKWQ